MNVTIRHDYRPFLGPVRDQGARPTCLAHASTTAHEHARGSKVALSPEYLHYFAAENADAPAGVDFPNVARALFDPGQPPDSDCPYHENDPPSMWTPPANLTLYRRQSVSTEPRPDEVEALLDAGRVPVLGISPAPSTGVAVSEEFWISIPIKSIQRSRSVQRSAGVPTRIAWSGDGMRTASTSIP